jgi:Flp pilus assembly pilin Flp
MYAKTKALLSDRGASEMVAVVILVVLVLAIGALAVPQVKDALMGVFNSIAKSISGAPVQQLN